MKRIAIALSVVLLAIGLMAWIKREAKPDFVWYESQKDCETKTGKSCKYGMCDYKCDVYWSGWVPQSN